MMMMTTVMPDASCVVHGDVGDDDGGGGDDDDDDVDDDDDDADAADDDDDDGDGVDPDAVLVLAIHQRGYAGTLDVVRS